MRAGGRGEEARRDGLGFGQQSAGAIQQAIVGRLRRGAIRHQRHGRRAAGRAPFERLHGGPRASGCGGIDLGDQHHAPRVQHAAQPAEHDARVGPAQSRRPTGRGEFGGGAHPGTWRALMLRPIGPAGECQFGQIVEQPGDHGRRAAGVGGPERQDGAPRGDVGPQQLRQIVATGADQNEALASAEARERGRDGGRRHAGQDGVVLVVQRQAAGPMSGCGLGGRDSIDGGRAGNSGAKLTSSAKTESPRRRPERGPGVLLRAADSCRDRR